MILDEIAAHTRRRVALAKEAVPLERLRDLAAAKTAAVKTTARTAAAQAAFPFEAALSRPALSFICEVKKASPSKGIIAADFPYLRIAGEYEAAGAVAISVLTEPEYFLGSDDHLREIAAAVKVPVLRKDFIIDTYQIYEAALLGAKAVLLIRALLEPAVLAEYAGLAAGIGLSALVEVHTEDETRSAVDAGGRIIGINNRDLKTFQVDLGTTGRLRKLIPPGTLVVAESGIRGPADIRALGDYDIDGVLIGETLMRAADKRRYLQELRNGSESQSGAELPEAKYGKD
jgi:indole-3-glycerol phosphate synthase